MCSAGRSEMRTQSSCWRRATSGCSQVGAHTFDRSMLSDPSLAPIAIQYGRLAFPLGLQQPFDCPRLIGHTRRAIAVREWHFCIPQMREGLLVILGSIFFWIVLYDPPACVLISPCLAPLRFDDLPTCKMFFLPFSPFFDVFCFWRFITPNAWRYETLSNLRRLCTRVASGICLLLYASMSLRKQHLPKPACHCV